jgi:hypothetical protein
VGGGGRVRKEGVRGGEGVQKKRRGIEYARIARFYGINPWELTPRQALELHSAISVVWAEETLRERGGELTPESLLRLTELATGDRQAAEKAYAERVLELERRKHARET